MVDLDILSFLSTNPPDKVVATGSIQVVNSGATSNDSQSALIVTSTADNPYGTAVFVRGAYSIDGGLSYNSLSSHIIYTFTYTDTSGPFVVTLNGLKAGCSIGVKDNLIYFRTANGFHGNVSYTSPTQTYTPTSLTFDIKYALFEKS